MIYIDSSIQKLYLFRDDTLVFESKISTSLYGMGCLEDTFKTPTGLHLIASKIGSGLPAEPYLNIGSQQIKQLSKTRQLVMIILHQEYFG